MGGQRRQQGAAATHGRGHREGARLWAGLAGLMMLAPALVGGCAAGEGEHNYRELERDPQPLQPERDPMFGRGAEATPSSAIRGGGLVFNPSSFPAARARHIGASSPTVLAAAIAAQAAPDTENAEAAEAVDEPARAPQDAPSSPNDASNDAPNDATDAGAPDTPGVVAADEPIQTLRGRDRRDWEPVTFRLTSGQIVHRPTYIGTPPVADELPRLRRGLPVGARLALAMEGETHVGWTGDGMLRLVFEPVWFSIESALLPVAAIVHPPTARELTPPEVTEPAAQRLDQR